MYMCFLFEKTQNNYIQIKTTIIQQKIDAGRLELDAYNRYLEDNGPSGPHPLPALIWYLRSLQVQGGVRCCDVTQHLGASKVLGVSFSDSQVQLFLLVINGLISPLTYPCYLQCCVNTTNQPSERYFKMCMTSFPESHLL